MSSKKSVQKSPMKTPQKSPSKKLSSEKKSHSTVRKNSNKKSKQAISQPSFCDEIKRQFLVNQAVDQADSEGPSIQNGFSQIRQIVHRTSSQKWTFAHLSNCSDQSKIVEFVNALERKEQEELVTLMVDLSCKHEPCRKPLLDWIYGILEVSPSLIFRNQAKFQHCFMQKGEWLEKISQIQRLKGKIDILTS